MTMSTTSTETPSASDILQFPRSGHVSITPGAAALDGYTGDLLVLAVWAPEDDNAAVENGNNGDAKKDKATTTFELPEQVKAFDTHGFIADLVADAEFSGKAGSSTEVGRMPSGGAKRVVVYGLGKRSAIGAGNAGMLAAKFAIQKGVRPSPGVIGLFVEDLGETDAKTTLANVAEGATVGAYVDERYKHADKRGDALKKIPSELQVVALSASGAFDEKLVENGVAIGMGVITTKEVVNSPANALTPHSLAAVARKVAEETGMTVEVKGRAECEKLGMGLYLGVGRGSTDEPQFIHMTYKPASSSGDGQKMKRIAIIGKAVTFDSGGTNLKVGSGSMIELMKFDMGGAGATLGAAKAIGVLKPSAVEVHFIMPAVENMLSDRAIHSGDILTASNGKTVEVINTDAEGRLCLADALVYAQTKLGEEQLDYVVDLATLTGAIIIALGNDVAGMWASSDELADMLKGAGAEVGEKFWRMPLVDEYVEGIKSRIADLKNVSGGRAGSSITAALFLREFVTAKHWAHLDIAGTVWAEKKDGATGFGAKTLVKWVEGLDQ